MAITRTQIAKQLLAQGGRTGFQGGGADAGTKSFAESQGRSKAEVDQLGRDFGFSGSDVAGDSGRQRPDSVITPPSKPSITKDNFKKPNKFITPATAFLNFLGKKFSGSKLAMLNNALQRNNYLATLTPEEQVETLKDLAAIGIGTDNPMGIDRNIERGMGDTGILGTGIGGGKFITDPAFGGPEAKAVLGKDYENYLKEQRDRFIPEDGGGEPPIIPIVPQVSKPDEEEKIKETFTPNIRLLAGGGMAERAPYEGGIMDLESARQMYGLGKLVKKVTRSVKKIAKSPLGKAAIGAALFKFGPAFLSGQGFGLGTAKKFSDLKFLGEGANVNLFRAIGIPSILAGLTAEEEDTNQEQYAGADLPFPVDYYLQGNYPPNVRLAAEGGLMRSGYQEGSKEPVAKKTMPLLDMGGMEKDYREEGGFVPIGRMEKADDVPARLSKNEFVFTADAVRNAGNGDVDLGAEKMYNMMKNLEAGGDVSEESQGMDGARKMFQTSQRLEEVI